MHSLQPVPAVSGLFAVGAGAVAGSRGWDASVEQDKCQWSFLCQQSPGRRPIKILDRLKILKPKKAYLLFCGNASNHKERENKDKRNAWRGGEHCANGDCNYLHAARRKRKKANDKKETQQDTRADETKGKGNCSDCR